MAFWIGKVTSTICFFTGKGSVTILLDCIFVINTAALLNSDFYFKKEFLSYFYSDTKNGKLHNEQITLMLKVKYGKYECKWAD